ncbi:MAG: hypothetical protein ABH879_04385 [archaeon]
MSIMKNSIMQIAGTGYTRITYGISPLETRTWAMRLRFLPESWPWASIQRWTSGLRTLHV